MRLKSEWSAGDVVPKKKPDPAIYLLAAKELGVQPDRWGLLLCTVMHLWCRQLVNNILLHASVVLKQGLRC